MTRAIDLELEPADSRAEGLKVSTLTYTPKRSGYASMCETVYLTVETHSMCSKVRLTPDEARVLANQLMQVADVAEEERDRRTSFEQIQEELREADERGGDTGCMYAHPDVHYVPADRVAEKVRALEKSDAPRFIVFAEPVEVSA